MKRLVGVILFVLSFASVATAEISQSYAAVYSKAVAERRPVIIYVGITDEMEKTAAAYPNHLHVLVTDVTADSYRKMFNAPTGPLVIETYVEDGTLKYLRTIGGD